MNFWAAVKYVKYESGKKDLSKMESRFTICFFFSDSKHETESRIMNLPRRESH